MKADTSLNDWQTRWDDESEYEYLKGDNISKHHLAWEFLRRDTRYQSSYKKYKESKLEGHIPRTIIVKIFKDFLFFLHPFKEPFDPSKNCLEIDLAFLKDRRLVTIYELTYDGCTEGCTMASSEKYEKASQEGHKEWFLDGIKHSFDILKTQHLFPDIRVSADPYKLVCQVDVFSDPTDVAKQIEQAMNAKMDLLKEAGHAIEIKEKRKSGYFIEQLRCIDGELGCGENSSNIRKKIFPTQSVGLGSVAKRDRLKKAKENIKGIPKLFSH